MRAALHKLTISLPADLLEEEYQDLHQEDDVEKNGTAKGTGDGKPRHVPISESAEYQVPQPQNFDAPERQSGYIGHIKKFFVPTKFASAAVLSRYTLSPHLAEPVRPYTQRERREAYVRPAVLSACPTIWLAKDKYGLSRQEMLACREEVGEGLTITDECAWYDEKNQVQFDQTNVRKAPIWEETPLY